MSHNFELEPHEKAMIDVILKSNTTPEWIYEFNKFLIEERTTGEIIKFIDELLHQELQKAREEEKWRIWEQLAELADDGEDSFISAGDLNTHLDDVHKIIFTKDSTVVEKKTPLPEYAPWKDSYNALTIKESTDQSDSPPASQPPKQIIRRFVRLWG